MDFYSPLGYATAYEELANSLPVCWTTVSKTTMGETSIGARAVARNGSVGGGVGTNFADRRAWSRVWSWEWLLLCSAAGWEAQGFFFAPATWYGITFFCDARSLCHFLLWVWRKSSSNISLQSRTRHCNLIRFLFLQPLPALALIVAH